MDTNLINNLLTEGPDSRPQLIDVRSDNIYLEGNSVGGEYEAGVTPRNSRNNVCPEVDQIPLEQVAEAISRTSGAGATIAQGRDATDTRLVSEANSRQGQIPDCINGLQVISSNVTENNNCAKSVTHNPLQPVDDQPLIDPNQIDGVPNAWKISRGGAALHGENYNTHKRDSNGDGYTDFEDWVFEVFGI